MVKLTPVLLRNNGLNAYVHVGVAHTGSEPHTGEMCYSQYLESVEADFDRGDISVSRLTA